MKVKAKVKSKSKSGVEGEGEGEVEGGRVREVVGDRYNAERAFF